METRKGVFWAVYVTAVVAALLLVMAIVAIAPTQAHAAELTAGQATLTTQSTTAAKAKAATKAPYKDATVKWVGKKAMKNIAWVKAHKGYKGVIKGAKFHPYKNMTKGQFAKVLNNLYGKKAPDATKKEAKQALTDRYAKNMLVKTAKNCFGVKIYWGEGATKKLGRATAANYIGVFRDFDSAFKRTVH